MTETTETETRPLRRGYWDLLLDFMGARLQEEFEALTKYARGEPAEISLAVGMRAVMEDGRGDTDVYKSVHADVLGRMDIVIRCSKARGEVREYARSGGAKGDAVLAKESAGLGYAVLQLSAAYRDHADHPGMYPW